MNTIPLLPNADVDTIVAYRGARPVTRVEFLRDVLSVADQFPDTGHALNLCKDRYWFAVALFAAIARGTLSVLPGSTSPETIAGLSREHPDLIHLSDQPATSHNLPCLQIPAACKEYKATDMPAVPDIPAERLIMHVYTSGSTGKPQRHPKTFGRICQCAEAEARRMWDIAGGARAVLGTVPSQHMYGLESTIFMPLLGGGQLSSRLPFFPADVAAALNELTAPALLVTTPFHLRKLLDSDIPLPPVAAIVSATARLPRELAEETEARLGAPIIEIYGSTETGQIATRQPTRHAEWALYEGIVLSQEDDVTVASGGHLEESQRLNDILELCSPTRFRLLGRNSDMVNVAGKRSSLSFLNQIITSLPGVRDGVFCMPRMDIEHGVSRLAAFVVAPELRAQDIHSALQQKVEPVFLPRPIIFLDALPRDGNGKITAATMAELIARHIP